MELIASVECGKYFKADRGTLTLTDGQLKFETEGRCLFDLPLSSIQKLVWHWYSFSAAFEATIEGKKYFLSFVPRYATLGIWYGGMCTGARWRAAIAGRQPRPLGLQILFRSALAAVFVCIFIISQRFVFRFDPLLAVFAFLTCMVFSGIGLLALAGMSAMDIAVWRRSKT